MRDPFDEARDAIQDQHERDLDAVDRQYERDRKRLEDHALGLQEQLDEAKASLGALHAQVAELEERHGMVTDAAQGWQAAYDREHTKYEDLVVRYEAVCKTNDALTTKSAQDEGIIDRLRDRVRELQHR